MKEDFPYTYTVCKCNTCNREFLVERILIGTDHTLDIIVSCKECLKKKEFPEGFMKEHLEEAKLIQLWLEKH